MTTHSLSFSVSGDFLTEFFRELVAEGRWDYSLKALVADIHGMSTDTAIEILSGAKKLTGDQSSVNPDGIKLVDEAEEVKVSYLEKLGYMYGHYYEHTNRKCYIPYAIVDSYGRPDAIWAKDKNYGEFPEISIRSKGIEKYHLALNDFSCLRALYYADDQQRDIAFPMEHPKTGEDMMILFKIAEGIPPLWMTRAATPKEAFSNCIKYGRSLERRGYDSDVDDGDSLKDLRKKIQEVLPESSESVLQDHSDSELEDARADLDRLDRVNSTLDKMKETRIEHARAEVIAQADSQENGWMDLPVMDKGGKVTHRVRVPRGAFEGWALRPMGRHMMTVPWQPVSSSGWKMYNDDQYHTDWILGAGLDIDKWYTLTDGNKDPIVDSAYSAMFDLQRKLLNFECVVLSGKGRYSGDVVIPKPGETVPEGSIIVIPTASPEYELAMLSACKNGKGAVITEVGGKLCHLATIGREFDVKIVRVENATEIYNKWMKVSVDCNNGKVDIYVQ